MNDAQILANSQGWTASRDEEIPDSIANVILRDLSGTNAIGISDYKHLNSLHTFKPDCAKFFVGGDGPKFVEPADEMKGYVARAIFYFLMF